MNKQTVANAVRIEFNPKTDELYIVFQVVDEQFKNKIKDNWMQDIELKLIGRSLAEEK
jgi:hypothetical protein